MSINNDVLMDIELAYHKKSSKIKKNTSVAG